MRKVALGFALLSIAFAGGPVHGAARAAEGNGNGGLKWEYRVLTRDQISDLGKKDLAVGLNKLGNEGWELAAIDSSYIFKRPKVLNRISVEDAKNELTLIEADVDMLKERVAWS